MELIDKSALVAEIERRIESVEKRLKVNTSYSKHAEIAWERDKALYDSYNQILSFIDSLQEEPVSDVLDEAAKIYASGEYDRKNPSSLSLQCKGCYSPLIYAFKAGAKWRKAKDESTTEDLGEYINELSKQFPEVSFAKLSRIAVRVAQWQLNKIRNKYEKNRD